MCGDHAAWKAGIADATSPWDTPKALAAAGALELYRLLVQMRSTERMRSVNAREVADRCVLVLNAFLNAILMPSIAFVPWRIAPQGIPPSYQKALKD